MTDQDILDQGARYDRMASGYERWWAPVLAPSAHALLDRLDGVVEAGDRVLDVGAGTGNLTRGALARWPDAHVTAIDASGEMLAALDAAIASRPEGEQARYASRTADAAALPYDDATFDVVMSSFVLQLVSSRAKALREIRRVLRPGGTLAYVTWLRREAPFAPDRIFDDLLAEAGYEDEPPDARCGDVPSVSTGAAEMRSAGFRDVTAEEGRLAYAFTVDSYIGFLTEFDEESLFDEMGRTERRRFVATLRERLMALDPNSLVFGAPIVTVTGRRSR